jgi:hypothetical protein
MIALLATIRPHAWNFPLFLHVAGAAVFFGVVALAAVAQLTAARTSAPELLRRIAFRALLFVGLPAYIVFRIGAEWLYTKEFPGDVKDPTWIGIGYMVADIGALVFLIALILAGISARKQKGWLTQTSGVLSAILFLALLVAIWAMGAKPT